MDFFEFFTREGNWIYANLIAVFISTFIVLLNQYFKIPGSVLVFWARVCTVALMTPFMFIIDWPENPIYYVAVFATAFFGAFADTRLFNVSSKYGGGVVSRTTPLAIFTTFVVWLFFEPELIGKYISEPFRTAGIVLAMAGCVFFSMRIKKCEVSREALFAMLPVVLCYTVTGVLNKFSMSKGSHDGVVFCYMYLQSVGVIPIMAAYLYSTNKNKFGKFNINFLFNKYAVKVGLFFAILWIGSMTFKNTAMITIPNPAYGTVLGQLSPVLISVIYYFLKHKEEGDVKSGFGIVACALLMSLLVIHK